MVIPRKWLAIALTLVLAGAQNTRSTPLFAQQQPFSTPSTSQQLGFASQQVVRFHTESSAQFDTLLQTAHILQLDVWSAHRGKGCASSATPRPAVDAGCIDIRLASTAVSTESSQELLQQLMQQFTAAGPRLALPQRSVIIQDLQALIDSQTAKPGHTSVISNQSWHETYHTYDEITAQLHYLAQTYPEHARTVEIGKTHEGRTIWGIKIGSGQNSELQSPAMHAEEENKSPKAGIVIIGEQHAREWISASTTTYFASELLRVALESSDRKDDLGRKGLFNRRKGRKGGKKRKGKKGRKSTAAPWSRNEANLILSTFDITFVPLANPDGYVYSWEKNRMWRKNRQPNKFPSGLFCNGVDLNRNWGFEFSAESVSTFGSPCSELYPGTTAFSAAETRALAYYLQDPQNNVKGFFDLHSYGQLLMYPYSWNCDAMVPDEEDLLELGLGAVKSLKNVHGRTFSAGKMCQVYAQSGGNAVDWAYAASTPLASGEDPQPDPEPEPTPGKHKIKWSYSVELRDGGTYGFLLPPQQIIPSSQEISKALMYMLGFIAKVSLSHKATKATTVH